jgi:membrane-associated protease RseP (regulator of RpoE activity)
MIEVGEYVRSGMRFAFLAMLQLGIAQPVLAQSAAGHGGSSTSKSGSELEDRLRSELRILLMDLAQSGAFGRGPVDQISLTLDSPAERTFDLGVLVDSRSGSAARKGLVVLGTTPGSLAARLGLRSGDTLVAVNGVSLADLGDDSGGAARAAGVLRDTVSGLTEGALLQFRIARGDAMQELEGTMASIEIPAFHLSLGGSDSGIAAAGVAEPGSIVGTGCGRVSVFDNAPRQKQLHGVTLISIDGHGAPPTSQVSVQLPAGRHELKVGERIDARYLGFGDRFRDRGAQNRYKTITVEVAADTTYFLAAHLNSDHRNEWRDGAYWDPVVWTTSHEDCR